MTPTPTPVFKCGNLEFPAFETHFAALEYIIQSGDPQWLTGDPVGTMMAMNWPSGPEAGVFFRGLRVECPEWIPYLGQWYPHEKTPRSFFFLGVSKLLGGAFLEYEGADGEFRGAFSEEDPSCFFNDSCVLPPVPSPQP
jgi:hypothetical protein